MEPQLILTIQNCIVFKASKRPVLVDADGRDGVPIRALAGYGLGLVHK